ncbi:MAG: type I-MYXAN CRISPR-associated protein Cas6/Cmx6 [Thermodesulfobacteriota bacterium]|nr:type I-MYXAN CRISPR-associated protein Cas6/Cmx6 [Thermodesulfobacteriota bacterium]
MTTKMKVDLRFHVFGQSVKVDHGYALFAAISRVLPEFHEAGDVGLRLIRGRYMGNGQLNISPVSNLVFRLPVSKVAEYINLAGKTLDLDGHQLRIGVPNSQALVPATALYSHIVTTKNGNDQKRFEEEIKRQMETLDCRGRLSVGKRKTFKLHGKQVVGYSVLVSELTAEESITLQEHGLGGRRKMGCGFFEPKRM